MAKTLLKVGKRFCGQLLFALFSAFTYYLVVAGQGYRFILQLTPQTGSTFTQVWAGAHQAGGGWLQFQLIWLAAVGSSTGLLLFSVVLLAAVKPASQEAAH